MIECLSKRKKGISENHHSSATGRSFFFSSQESSRHRPGAPLDRETDGVYRPLRGKKSKAKAHTEKQQRKQRPCFPLQRPRPHSRGDHHGIQKSERLVAKKKTDGTGGGDPTVFLTLPKYENLNPSVSSKSERSLLEHVHTDCHRTIFLSRRIAFCAACLVSSDKTKTRRFSRETPQQGTAEGKRRTTENQTD